ncbi:hypothetical protein BK816_05185 [Boudabousia tangfeifanii]|uniref:DUF3052 domain-containing protein n=1 Tax=Boudabousia tangfeifanii TaxID=1912795 RepID=A0A1D9MMF0_9ACTO|nr:hypothetical protein BK816_05185 [Boudabousia tangfeifanii]
MRTNFAFGAGAVVQEFYFDDDCDQAIRTAIEAETKEELVDEDYSDMVDGAIIWWRAEDGEVEDLTDLLVDAASNLDGSGTLWVLTPKAGDEQHVPPFEVNEAAKVAGLNATTATALGKRWAGTRLTSRGRA